MKKMLLLPLLLLPTVYSYGASFDCSKARSWPEKMICSDPILSIEDERLSKIYQLAKKKTGNSKEFKALVKKNWQERERCTSKVCIEDWYVRVGEEYKRIIEKDVVHTDRGAGEDPEVFENPPDQLAPKPLPKKLSKDEEAALAYFALNICLYAQYENLEDGKIDIMYLTKMAQEKCRDNYQRVLELVDKNFKYAPNKYGIVSSVIESQTYTVMSDFMKYRKKLEK